MQQQQKWVEFALWWIMVFLFILMAFASSINDKLDILIDQTQSSLQRQ